MDNVRNKNTILVLPELSISKKITLSLEKCLKKNFNILINGSYHRNGKSTYGQNICEILFYNEKIPYSKFIRAKKLPFCTKGEKKSVYEFNRKPSSIHSMHPQNLLLQD